MDEDEIAQSKKVCGENGAFEFPVYVSPIAIAFNLKGVDKLNLDAATAAKIFAGKITKWNDPQIAKLNPEADLRTPRSPLHRSDESGTARTYRLPSTRPQGRWPHEAAEEFPAEYGGEAAQGTDGVVSLVADTEGAISYADASASPTTWARPPSRSARTSSSTPQRLPPSSTSPQSLRAATRVTSPSS